MSLPAEIRFAESHEYVIPTGDTVTVGISSHAAEQLGDVVFVELPKLGRQVKQGESFGVVESVKAVSDLYAPVTGEVIEVNSALEGEPALVNEDPYGKGWILKIKAVGPNTGDHLMDATAYEMFAASH